MSDLRIPLSAPDIDERDIEAVFRVLRSSRLSLGPALVDFEQAMAGYIGVPHAAAVSSGTAGLQLALLALGIGPGDEVIVPSFTFIAAANAIRYVAAVPVFVDVEPITLDLDPERVQSAITARTRALMVVHTFGVPADMDALLAMAARHHLRVIEDACEAIGAEYAGRKVGSFGDAAVFAFYPNKQITTGEGGIVLTPDSAVAESVRSLRNQGRRNAGEWLEHVELGYNCRLSEMSCALGLSQLGRIESILAMRAGVAAAYTDRLQQSDDLMLPPLELARRKLSWFVYVIRLAPWFTREQRDGVLRRLTKDGVGCGRYFAPVHLQGAYLGVPSAQVSLPVTEFVSDRTIALPFFNRLSTGEIDQVCASLLAAIDSIR